MNLTASWTTYVSILGIALVPCLMALAHAQKNLEMIISAMFLYIASATASVIFRVETPILNLNGVLSAIAIYQCAQMLRQFRKEKEASTKGLAFLFLFSGAHFLLLSAKLILLK